MKDLTDQQLLKIILRNQFEKVANRKLRDLIHSERRELKLTEIAYQQMMASFELGRRLCENKPNLNSRISSTQAAIEFCTAHFGRLISDGLQEEFHIVTLDTKKRMIGSHLITVGTLDASLVHPREVFRPAIRDSSSCILLAHNHPSGDACPSPEDQRLTKRLSDAGDVLGINVLDHIVLAREGCISMRESCDLAF